MFFQRRLQVRAFAAGLTAAINTAPSPKAAAVKERRLEGGEQIFSILQRKGSKEAMEVRIM